MSPLFDSPQKSKNDNLEAFQNHIPTEIHSQKKEQQNTSKEIPQSVQVLPSVLESIQEKRTTANDRN